MKDNFSYNSPQYQKFRPTYPAELYELVMQYVESKEMAWDCGTGNGQVAVELARHFSKVYATDISKSQIENATRADNIFYSIQPAEHTNFPGSSFDLIAVAQAIHWFKFDEFYAEVKRLLKPNGLCAVIGYGLIETEEAVSRIIQHFYFEVIGPYWDNERKYIDEAYQTIPFPFKEIPTPQLYNQFEWSMEQLLGYIETWSAVQHYKQTNQQDTIGLLKKELQSCWPAYAKKIFRFPILLRMGNL